MSRRIRAAFTCAIACAVHTLLASAVPVTRPQVLASTPHDPEAFTEGLFLHEGMFFESTGLVGRSSLRQVNPDTGEIARQVELAGEFGEGIALVSDSIWFLTWKDQTAHRFLASDFSLVESVSYEGEGWGLCFDGTRLVMSDGSSSLQFRDPHSFELLGRVDVTRDGVAVAEINELECVSGHVYANVWHTDFVLQIDPETGLVVSQIDASGLLTDAEAKGVDVLNGIAHDAESGHFFLTGKYWPKVFEVTFDAASLPPTADSGDAGQTPTLGDAAPDTATSADDPVGSGCGVSTLGRRGAGLRWPSAAFALLLSLCSRRARRSK